MTTRRGVSTPNNPLTEAELERMDRQYEIWRIRNADRIAADFRKLQARIQLKAARDTEETR